MFDKVVQHDFDFMSISLLIERLYILFIFGQALHLFPLRAPLFYSRMYI